MILAQKHPYDTTLQTLYTVPAGKSAVLDSLIVSNQGSATTFRVAVNPYLQSDPAARWLYYDLPIDLVDTFIAEFGTKGLSLSSGDRVEVQVGALTLGFQLYGTET